MTKWDYICIRNAASVKYIAVGPARKIDIQWLVQRFPKSRIEYSKDTGEDWLQFRTPEECHQAYRALIEHLGSEGWEPFAAGLGLENALHLRRSE